MRTRIMALLLSSAALAASAAPLTYSFSGQVGFDEAERGFVGFAGSFVVDASAVDAIADPSTGAYLQPFSFKIAFDGGVPLELGAAYQLLTTNDLGGSDQLGAFASGADGELSLSLFDFTQTLLTSDALPATPISLASFGWSELRWYDGAALLTGMLDSLSCTQGCSSDPTGPTGPVNPQDPSHRVPLPSSLLLTGGALALLGHRRSNLELRP